VARLDLLRTPYTGEEQARLESLRSRINVARAILDARLSAGLSQEEVGKAAGTKQSRVSEIEGMKGNPQLDTLDRIGRVLGLMVALVPVVGIEPALPELESWVVDSRSVVVLTAGGVGEHMLDFPMGRING